MGLKIALVCGHFLPGMGYVEVHLANTYAQQGHEVHVFTSDQIPSYVQGMTAEHYQVGTTKVDDYYITRVHAHFSKGQMVKAKSLVNAVEGYEPELVIVIGVGKLFPKPIYSIKSRKFKVVTLFGDNEDTYEESLKQKLLLVLKKPVYKAAVATSDALVSYTPSTEEIVAQLIPQRLRKQLSANNLNSSLGFDQHHFQYTPEVREATRAKVIGLEEHPLLITATRVTPFKRLERVIEAVDALNAAGTELHYLILGFGKDEYSQQLQERMQQSPFAARLHALPFAPREELVQWYNAADFGHWPNAAISIFEALGCGLPLWLPEKKNISHILEEGTTGTYHTDPKLGLQQLLQLPFDRNAIAQKALQFSWPVIATNILNHAGVHVEPANTTQA